jgi:hypothetical protein
MDSLPDPQAPLAPARPPQLPPAAVIHGPGEGVDRLLHGFAAELIRRGFRVGGVVQLTGEAAEVCAAPMDLLDLRTGRSIPISQRLGRGSSSCRVDPAGVAEAAPLVREALARGVDLLVVNKFGGLEAGGGGLAAELAEAVAAGVPVLTSVGAKHLSAFLGFAGDLVRPLPPQEPALWRWWGGCRLYDDLRLGVEDEPVLDIACRPPWVLVRTRRGAGLARLPAGVLPPAAEGLSELASLGLAGLAAGLDGWDPFRTALAVAALNAHWNRPDLNRPGAPGLAEGNGLDALAAEPGPQVAVGGFPGLARHLPRAAVIEAEPGPGEHPAEAADWLLPGAAAAVLTAATLSNRTLPRLLALAGGARVALVGPTAPLSDRLHAYGVEFLCGFVADDPEGLARAVRAGAGPRGWLAHGRQVVRTRA